MRNIPKSKVATYNRTYQRYPRRTLHPSWTHLICESLWCTLIQFMSSTPQQKLNCTRLPLQQLHLEHLRSPQYIAELCLIQNSWHTNVLKKSLSSLSELRSSQVKVRVFSLNTSRYSPLQTFFQKLCLMSLYVAFSIRVTKTTCSTDFKTSFISQ